MVLPGLLGKSVCQKERGLDPEREMVARTTHTGLEAGMVGHMWRGPVWKGSDIEEPPDR